MAKINPKKIGFFSFFEMYYEYISEQQKRKEENMKNDVLILGARPYDFTDEKTNRQVSGVSVWVLPS